MKSIKSKKQLVIFAALVSLSCFTYLNFIVESPLEINPQTQVEESISSPKALAPDLKIASRMVEIGKRLLVPVR